MQGAMLEMGLNAQGYIEQQRAYQEMLARNPDSAPISSTSSIRPTRGLLGIKNNTEYSVIGLLNFFAWFIVSPFTRQKSNSV